MLNAHGTTYVGELPNAVSQKTKSNKRRSLLKPSRLFHRSAVVLVSSRCKRCSDPTLSYSLTKGLIGHEKPETSPAMIK